MAEYGRLLSAPILERAVEETLRTWMPAYLGEVLAQAGHGRFDLPDPSDMVRQSEFDWPVEAQIALVVITSPGTTGDAVRGPEGYDATWDVRAGVVADLGEYTGTREAMQFYAAAAGSALTHRGVPVEGASVRWLGENWGVLAERDSRTLMGGEARCAITVQEARSLYGGPLEPPDPQTRPEAQPDPSTPPLIVVPSIEKESLST